MRSQNKGKNRIKNLTHFILYENELTQYCVC